MPPVLCRQPAARAQLAAAAVLLLLALTALAAPAAGQGVAPSTRGALRAPAAVPNQMASLYGRAAEFSAQFRRNRRAACRQSGGSLCSAGSGEGGAAVLAWLASPQRFDARDRGLVSRVGDQGGCNACMSFALVGARGRRADRMPRTLAGPECALEVSKVNSWAAVFATAVGVPL